MASYVVSDEALERTQKWAVARQAHEAEAAAAATPRPEDDDAGARADGVKHLESARRRSLGIDRDVPPESIAACRRETVSL